MSFKTILPVFLIIGSFFGVVLMGISLLIGCNPLNLIVFIFSHGFNLIGSSNSNGNSMDDYFIEMIFFIGLGLTYLCASYYVETNRKRVEEIEKQRAYKTHCDFDFTKINETSQYDRFNNYETIRKRGEEIEKQRAYKTPWERFFYTSPLKKVFIISFIQLIPFLNFFTFMPCVLLAFLWSDPNWMYNKFPKTNFFRIIVVLILTVLSPIFWISAIITGLLFRNEKRYIVFGCFLIPFVTYMMFTLNPIIIVIFLPLPAFMLYIGLTTQFGIKFAWQ